MRERFAHVAGELLEEYPKLAVVLADISTSQFRSAGVTERYPNRTINVGIREQLMVGVGAGLALEGFRPIVHSYAPFLVERAFEQVKLDFAHQGLAGILVSIGASYDSAAAGRTHHAPGDVALVNTLPGWEIHVPGHADEAERVLRDAAAASGSVYIRLSERANADPMVEGVGRIALLREGSSGAPVVLAIGPMLDRVEEATRGLDVTLVYTATPRPLDGDSLRGAMTGVNVVVVEPYLEGTSAAAVSEALDDRPHRLHSVGVKNRDLRNFGEPGEHDRAHGLDAGSIRERIEALSA